MARFLKVELCLVILGIATGFGFSVLNTVFLPWTRFDKVTGTPTELFMTNDLVTVYVKTSEGSLFSCSRGDGRCLSIEADSATLTPYKDPDPYCKNPDSRTPLMFGSVAASSAVRVCGYEPASDIYLIALNNGSILMRVTSINAQDMTALFAAFLGGVGGLVLGISLFAVSHFFRRRSQGKAKNDFKQL